MLDLVAAGQPNRLVAEAPRCHPKTVKRAMRRSTPRSGVTDVQATLWARDASQR
ncbi:MAG: hypothetical protein H6526_03000 [Actinobacteria bacterium]|nr:hypothetical protein [Actinomycetota bacterium]